jgi:hypothetical protein
MNTDEKFVLHNKYFNLVIFLNLFFDVVMLIMSHECDELSEVAQCSSREYGFQTLG